MSTFGETSRRLWAAAGYCRPFDSRGLELTARQQPQARRQSSNRGWLNPITAGDGIKIAGILVVLAGFYFNTNSRLGEHDKELVELRALVLEAKTKSVNVGETDRTEREKARAEFLVKAEKTSDGIGELNKRMAVQETLQATMSQTLSKISDQLGAALTPHTSSRK